MKYKHNFIKVLGCVVLYYYCYFEICHLEKGTKIS